MKTVEFIESQSIFLPLELYEEVLAFSKLISDAAFDADFTIRHAYLEDTAKRLRDFFKNSDEKIGELNRRIRHILRKPTELAAGEHP